MEINYVHTEQIHNTSAAFEVLPFVYQTVNPSSVVDVGCGTGSWLKVARDLGAKKVTGIDGIRVDEELLCINQDEFLQHNLTLPFKHPDRYDLCICLEVVEHLPEAHSETIIDTLTGLSDIILFSAGIPGQGGQYHINEQWPAYWQQKFAAHDYLPVDNLRPIFWENARVDWWYRQNMLLYIKKDLLDKLGLQAAPVLHPYIHTELLALKMKQIKDYQDHIMYLENMIDKEITNPRFLPSVKKMVKSLFK